MEQPDWSLPGPRVGIEVTFHPLPSLKGEPQASGFTLIAAEDCSAAFTWLKRCNKPEGCSLGTLLLSLSAINYKGGDKRACFALGETPPSSLSCPFM